MSSLCYIARSLANVDSQCLENVYKTSIAGLFHNAMTVGSPALRRAPGLDHPVARALLFGQRVQGFIISIDDREHDMIDR